MSLVVQVTQQSPVGYLQKSAGQPVPQLPTAHSIQQQFSPPSTALGSKTGKDSPPGNQNGQKGSLEAQAGAGGQTALKLPLLRPAPPVLKPFAGLLCKTYACSGALRPPSSIQIAFSRDAVMLKV